MPRRVIAYGLVILAVLPIPVGVLWLLARSAPPGYTRPSDFTPEEISNQAAEFITASSRFADAMADETNRTPVDVTFTDGMINGHLRSRAGEIRRRLPEWLSNPQVVFTADDIVGMADVRLKKVDTILSVHVVPEVTEDGQLRVRVAGMKAGRLPLPDAVRGAITEHADGRVRKLRERVEELKAKGDKKGRKSAEFELETMTALAGLCRGEEIVLDTPDHHLRLEALELLPHRLRIVGTRVDKPDR